MLIRQLKEDLHINNNYRKGFIIPKGYVAAEPFVDVLLELSEYNQWTKKKRPILKIYYEAIVNIICHQKGVNRIPNLIIGTPFTPEDMWIHPLILIEGLCQKNENLKFERLFFSSQLLETKDYSSIENEFDTNILFRINYNGKFFNYVKNNDFNFDDFGLFKNSKTYEEVLKESSTPKKTSGYIYFVQDCTTENIKVARTTNLDRNIKTLKRQSAGDVKLLAYFQTDDCVGMENELHLNLVSLRIEDKKKWYRFESFLKDFLLLFDSEYPKELSKEELSLLDKIWLQMYSAYTAEIGREFKLKKLEKLYKNIN